MEVTQQSNKSQSILTIELVEDIERPLTVSEMESQVQLETLVKRVPYLAIQIFDYLDIKSLLNCVRVSKSWYQFIIGEKSLQRRIFVEMEWHEKRQIIRRRRSRSNKPLWVLASTLLQFSAQNRLLYAQ